MFEFYICGSFVFNYSLVLHFVVVNLLTVFDDVCSCQCRDISHLQPTSASVKSVS